MPGAVDVETKLLLIPTRPRSHQRFWSHVLRVLLHFETPYPVQVLLLKRVKSAKAHSGYLWRDAIGRELFRVRVREWRTGDEQADLELMLDTFLHEMAHVLHYQPHHEISSNPKIHDEAWGVYFSKVYCVAYQTE